MKVLKEFESFENKVNESKVVDTAVNKAIDFLTKELQEFGTVEAKLVFLDKLQDRIPMVVYLIKKKKYYKGRK